MHHSDALEDVARKYAEKLGRYYGRISRIKIAIEIPHRNHTSGNTFQVKVDVAVPGTNLCIATNAHSRLEYRDVKVALRDAFLLTKRRLEDYAKRKLDMVKRRAEHADLFESEDLSEEPGESAFEDFELPPYDLQDMAFDETEADPVTDETNEYTHTR
jgi:hypothetical protein